jgi:hypothetical protein
VMDSLYEFPLQIPFGGEVSWILVSPSLWSKICFHMVKLLDETKPPTYGTVTRYETILVVIKPHVFLSSRISCLTWLAHVWVNVWKVFNASDFHIYAQTDFFY